MEEKETTLKNYINENRLDIDNIVEDYYGYIYIIMKNTKSIAITNEDIEEMISDVFFAMWKNYKNLEENTKVKSYLAGIAKNRIKNKYRTTQMHYPITDYEEQLISKNTLESIAEEKEQNEIIKNSLKQLKAEEYQVFIKFYYENRKVKEIAEGLDISESKVKVILHRIRKKIKTKLKKGGYSYERR